MAECSGGLYWCSAGLYWGSEGLYLVQRGYIRFSGVMLFLYNMLTTSLQSRVGGKNGYQDKKLFCLATPLALVKSK